MGYPKDPKQTTLFGTKVEWVGLLGIYTKHYILGSGSLGQPTKICIYNYDATFSPVSMLKSVQIILTIAIYFDYEIWQMDIKTTFLNRNLTEDVYMMQPEGFVDQSNARKICKLNKSIYGLKQASQSWNIRFDEVVKGFGFIKNEE